jgi:exopolysaccharide production protein ExoZ
MRSKLESLHVLRFIAARIVVARVVPLYRLLTVVIFIGVLLQPFLFQHTTVSIGGLLKSLLFIPYQKAPGITQPMLFQGVDPDYEMFFYAIFACCIGYSRGPIIAAVTGIVLMSDITYSFVGKPAIHGTRKALTEIGNSFRYLKRAQGC